MGEVVWWGACQNSWDSVGYVCPFIRIRPADQSGLAGGLMSFGWFGPSLHHCGVMVQGTWNLVRTLS
jgi:hypothetical protein